MIPACRDEISTRPAETDFTLRVHVEIKFNPGKAGQFSTSYLIRFACIFFGFFFGGRLNGEKGEWRVYTVYDHTT